MNGSRSRRAPRHPAAPKTPGPQLSYTMRTALLSIAKAPGEVLHFVGGRTTDGLERRGLIERAPIASTDLWIDRRWKLTDAGIDAIKAITGR